jgi:hypothetical protein
MDWPQHVKTTLNSIVSGMESQLESFVSRPERDFTGTHYPFGVFLERKGARCSS